MNMQFSYRRNLHLKDLGRLGQSNRARIRPRGQRLRCDDVSSVMRATARMSQVECWVDIEIIRLPGMKGLAFDRDLGELYAGANDAFPFDQV
jgi:hypothetical protein